MTEFKIAKVLDQIEAGPVRYLEFLRERNMSLGIYRLTVGAVDPQSPHSEDEVYVVLKGKAMIVVGEEELAVSPGSIIFVKSQVSHRFHSITEELELLVFFAPAEYSNQPA
jgi:mannose-6-phosphate isomerase-like protein (cupin superfamily)